MGNRLYIQGKKKVPQKEERGIALISGPEAWEEDYTRRGTRWSGSTHDLPDFPEESRVLELGCGNGKAIAAMIHRGWMVTGIDFSSRAASLCRQVFPDLHSTVMVADARWCPFRDAVFDAVFATHVTGHMPALDRQLIADEMVRVLSPGGKIFFCDFSTRDFRFDRGNKTEEGTFQRGTGIITHYFSEEEVIDLFSPLIPSSIARREWSMRVRGCELVRSEIIAIFNR